MMSRKLCVLAFSLVMVACGSGRPTEPRVASFPLDAEQQRGQVLFYKFCHQCHPHGEKGLGPAINSNPAPMVAFRAQVRGGFGAMPSFPDSVISGPELDELLAFVSVQRKLTQ